MSIWDRLRTGTLKSSTVPPMPASAEVDEASDLDAALTDRDWTVLPAGTLTSSFAAPSGTLAEVSLGDPQHPRVVLIPGATGSKEDFVLLAPLLADAGYFVQSFDLAGQYQSAGGKWQTIRL